MARPPGVSNAEWRADVQHWQAGTVDRRNRLIAKRARDAAAMAGQGEASRTGMMNPPGHYPQAVVGCQQSAASPTNLSPSMLPWGYVPLHAYSDSDAHGGFNLNITFMHGAPQCSSPSGFNHDPRTPSPAFNADLNT
ncbi:putative methionyl-tRNA synthetase [Hordeum vulgare]|nr:putative methionyl-tRNA synthetase [Hordeum vulgare]